MASATLISCLDDVVVMLRSDCPTLEHAVSGQLSRLACIRGTICRCWNALGTVVAVLSLCKTLCS